MVILALVWNLPTFITWEESVGVIWHTLNSTGDGDPLGVCTGY